MRATLARIASILCLAMVPFLVALPSAETDVMPQLAMQVDEEVEEPNSPDVDPSETFELLIRTIQSVILGAFGAAPITVLVVSLLKRLPPLAGVSAPTITFAVATVFWILAAITTHFGFREELDSFFDLVVQIAPPIIAFITSMIGARAIYEASNAADIPVVGYKRT